MFSRKQRKYEIRRRKDEIKDIATFLVIDNLTMTSLAKTLLIPPSASCVSDYWCGHSAKGFGCPNALSASPGQSTGNLG